MFWARRRTLGISSLSREHEQSNFVSTRRGLAEGEAYGECSTSTKSSVVCIDQKKHEELHSSENRLHHSPQSDTDCHQHRDGQREFGYGDNDHPCMINDQYSDCCRLVYCQSCMLYFVKEQLFFTHLDRCTRGKTCEKCFQTFETHEELLDHMEMKGHIFNLEILWVTVSNGAFQILKENGKVFPVQSLDSDTHRMGRSKYFLFGPSLVSSNDQCNMGSLTHRERNGIYNSLDNTPGDSCYSWELMNGGTMHGTSKVLPETLGSEEERMARDTQAPPEGTVHLPASCSQAMVSAHSNNIEISLEIDAPLLVENFLESTAGTESKLSGTLTFANSTEEPENTVHISKRKNIGSEEQITSTGTSIGSDKTVMKRKSTGSRNDTVSKGKCIDNEKFTTNESIDSKKGKQSVISKENIIQTILCHSCHMYFIYKQSYQRHLKRCFSSNGCQRCGLKFTVLSELLKHIKETMHALPIMSGCKLSHKMLKLLISKKKVVKSDVKKMNAQESVGQKEKPHISKRALEVKQREVKLADPLTSIKLFPPDIASSPRTLIPTGDVPELEGNLAKDHCKETATEMDTSLLANMESEIISVNEIYDNNEKSINQCRSNSLLKERPVVANKLEIVDGAENIPMKKFLNVSGYHSPGDFTHALREKIHNKDAPSPTEIKKPVLSNDTQSNTNMCKGNTLITTEQNRDDSSSTVQGEATHQSIHKENNIKTLAGSSWHQCHPIQGDNIPKSSQGSGIASDLLNNCNDIKESSCAVPLPFKMSQGNVDSQGRPPQQIRSTRVSENNSYMINSPTRKASQENEHVKESSKDCRNVGQLFQTDSSSFDGNYDSKSPQSKNHNRSSQAGRCESKLSLHKNRNKKPSQSRSKDKKLSQIKEKNRPSHNRSNGSESSDEKGTGSKSLQEEQKLSQDRNSGRKLSHGEQFSRRPSQDDRSGKTSSHERSGKKQSHDKKNDSQSSEVKQTYSGSSKDQCSSKKSSEKISSGSKSFHNRSESSKSLSDKKHDRSSQKEKRGTKLTCNKSIAHKSSQDKKNSCKSSQEKRDRQSPPNRKKSSQNKNCDNTSLNDKKGGRPSSQEKQTDIEIPQGEQNFNLSSLERNSKNKLSQKEKSDSRSSREQRSGSMSSQEEQDDYKSSQVEESGFEVYQKEKSFINLSDDKKSSKKSSQEEQKGIMLLQEMRNTICTKSLTTDTNETQSSCKVKVANISSKHCPQNFTEEQEVCHNNSNNAKNKSYSVIHACNPKNSAVIDMNLDASFSLIDKTDHADEASRKTAKAKMKNQSLPSVCTIKGRSEADMKSSATQSCHLNVFHTLNSMQVCVSSNEKEFLPAKANSGCLEAKHDQSRKEFAKKMPGVAGNNSGRGLKRPRSFDTPMPQSKKLLMRLVRVASNRHSMLLQQPFDMNICEKIDRVPESCPGCSTIIDINTAVYNTQTRELAFWCKTCAWDIIFFAFV